MSTQLPNSIHWVFNQCDDAVKDALRAHWAKKWPRLEKLLASFPLDVQDVRADRHLPSAGRRQALVRLSRRAQAAGRNAGGRRQRQGDGGPDRPGDRSPGRRDQAAQGAGQQELPHQAQKSLARGSERGRSRPRRGLEHRHDFLQSFRPLLPLLAAHARHELRALEAKKLLHHGELTVADLLDETLTEAWRKYEDRPRDVSLETWLNQLLHGAIEQWIGQEPHPYRSVDQPVREEVPSDEQPQVDDQEWWAWLLGYRDWSTLADLLPARESVDSSSADADSEDAAAAGAASIDVADPAQMAADPLATVDERHRVWSLLGELPIVQRQALILNVLDGLAPHAIAVLQDRPESEVRGDIETARATLRERLLAGAAAPAEATGGDSAPAGGSAPKATRGEAAAASAAKPVAAAAGHKK